MGGCCTRDEDFESAKNFENLRILIEKDIIYFSEQRKAIHSETDDNEKDHKLQKINQILQYYNLIKNYFSKENNKYLITLDFDEIKSLLKEMHKFANIFLFEKFEENFKKLEEIIQNK